MKSLHSTLAKKLASILAPLAGNTTSHVRNSVDFVERIQQTPLEEDDCMVSFDVVSLFTKVPLDEALQVIAQRLREDPTLGERTTIPAEELCSLIKLCLEVTYFQFGEQFYRQVQGAAMGSPLSPVVANLYMEAFEQQALVNFPCKPRLWVRYVDNVFAVWPHTDYHLSEFHDDLNSQHPSIQFSMEGESDSKLAFLDVLVERKGTTILTSVFRKKTHTDHYLNFESHHHPRVKRGIIKCLRSRAEKVCHVSKRLTEFSHLRNVFTANGYPDRLVRSILPGQPTTTSTRSMTATGEPAPKLLFLPYIAGVTDRIERVCRPFGIRVICGYRGKMREALVKVKQPTPELDKKGVVYEVPCGECNHVYIGETGRTQRKWLTEHRAAVKKCDHKNGIAVHAWKSGHQVEWESAKVKEVAPNLAHRRIVEALHIHRTPNTTNLDCGLTLDSIWFPLLT